MLTKEDRRFIADTVAVAVNQAFDQRATSLATKEDLKKFATKDDLKSFATKEDLKSFPTKDDLVGAEKRIKKELRAEVRKDIHDEVEGLAILTQKEFGVVRSELATVNKKLDAVATTTREHEYYIRKFSVDIDQLKQRTGLTD